MKAIVGAMFVALIVWAFVLIGRAMMNTPSVQAAAIASTSTQYATPTFIPTQTPIPSPTIGYEATLAIAQSTADEARRVNAQVTAQHEQVVLSELQLTADTEYRAQQVLSWTAQAGPTIIPLTATQQVLMNTQIANSQALASGFLTATHQAPTQMAAIVQVQNVARYARVNEIVKIIGMGALILFMLAIVAFINRLPVAQTKAEVEPQKETVIQMRKDTGQGLFTQTRTVVPCSPEQLTELAELAVNGEKKFGINRLENHTRTFKSQRETLVKVRLWLQENDFVIKDTDGSVTLNADGEAFLTEWFDLHKLPDEYEFEKEPEIA